jgi:hypothetical protein
MTLKSNSISVIITRLTRSPTIVKRRAKPSGVQSNNISTPKNETHEYRKGRYEKISAKIKGCWNNRNVLKHKTVTTNGSIKIKRQ